MRRKDFSSLKHREMESSELCWSQLDLVWQRQAESLLQKPLSPATLCLTWGSPLPGWVLGSCCSFPGLYRWSTAGRCQLTSHTAPTTTSPCSTLYLCTAAGQHLSITLAAICREHTIYLIHYVLLRRIVTKKAGLHLLAKHKEQMLNTDDRLMFRNIWHWFCFWRLQLQQCFRRQKLSYSSFHLVLIHKNHTGLFCPNILDFLSWQDVKPAQSVWKLFGRRKSPNNCTPRLFQYQESWKQIHLWPPEVWLLCCLS